MFLILLNCRTWPAKGTRRHHFIFSPGSRRGGEIVVKDE
jgi:hypothetical protein